MITPNTVLGFAGPSDNSTVTYAATLGDILIGLDGDDTLTGDEGRDVMIGGAGGDTLQGGIGDDLLIGNRTIYDTNDVALHAIMTEWVCLTFANIRFVAPTGGTCFVGHIQRYQQSGTQQSDTQ